MVIQPISTCSLQFAVLRENNIINQILQGFNTDQYLVSYLFCVRALWDGHFCSGQRWGGEQAVIHNTGCICQAKLLFINKPTRWVHQSHSLSLLRRDRGLIWLRVLCEVFTADRRAKSEQRPLLFISWKQGTYSECWLAIKYFKTNPFLRD